MFAPSTGIHMDNFSFKRENRVGHLLYAVACIIDCVNRTFVMFSVEPMVLALRTTDSSQGNLDILKDSLRALGGVHLWDLLMTRSEINEYNFNSTLFDLASHMGVCCVYCVVNNHFYLCNFAEDFCIHPMMAGTLPSGFVSSSVRPMGAPSSSITILPQ